MPRKPTRFEKGTRYDMREINARIEKRRVARGVEVKQICADLKIERWDWSRKVRLDRSFFTIDEISKIADMLAAPIGWPFIDETIGELLERGQLAKRDSEDAAPEDSPGDAKQG